MRAPYADLEVNHGLPCPDSAGTLALRSPEVDLTVPLHRVLRAERETGPCPIILEVMAIRRPDGDVENPSFLTSSLSPALATAFGDLTRRAGLRGIRLTTLGPAERREVRRCLASTVGLLQSVRLWLYRTHPGLRADAAEMAIQCIGEGAEEQDAVGRFGMSARTATRSLASAGLPPPSLLRAVGRLLPPVLALQAAPSLRLAHVARPEFPSEEAFKKALRRVVGGSLGDLRACWGAEPVLARGFDLWREGDRIGQK